MNPLQGFGLLFILSLIPSFVWVWRMLPDLIEEQEEFEKAMALADREPTPQP